MERKRLKHTDDWDDDDLPANSPERDRPVFARERLPLLDEKVFDKHDVSMVELQCEADMAADREAHPEDYPDPDPPAVETASNGEDEQEAKPQEGRAANGQFAKGNRFAVGHVFNRRTTMLKAILYDAVHFRDMHTIVRRLVRQAEAGDVNAAKVLFDRLLGRVPQDEFRIEEERPDPNDQFL